MSGSLGRPEQFQMNIDAVRRFCLSFPGAKENLQWEDDLCFKVGGKIFAILAVDSVPPQLCFKCTPEKFAELVEHPEIIPAPYLGRYKWVLVQRPDGLGTAQIEDLIRESYAMVAANAPKRRTRPSKKKPRNRR
jgi:predicted DNA-binding protein (MmcQ/YjbR family)